MIQFGTHAPDSEFATPATRFVDLPNDFTLHRGGRLSRARVAYETWGTPSAARDNTVLILGGLSASAHAASNDDVSSPGWWERMIGPGRPVDTCRWFVVCVSPLGGCFGSTGPASVEPETGRSYGVRFPDVCLQDTADAAAAVIHALGVRQVACVIGTSMGGMTSLALLARHPGLARSHINISGAARADAFAIALRSLQRQAIMGDPDWCGGRYERGGPAFGMRLARMLGTLSYRSPEEWQQRFARRPVARRGTDTQNDVFVPEFEIETYLRHQADRFVGLYDPNCYLYLGRAIDRFDLSDATDGDLDLALSQIVVERALVMGVESDLLFPIRQQETIARGLHLGNVPTELCRLDSAQGHDAFLVDIGRFGPPVERFLSTL